MKNFQLIDSRVDVVPLKLALQRQPELWNQFGRRTTFDNTPHGKTEDIWCRYRDISDLDTEEKYKANISKPHFPVWYPAWHRLPQLRSIVFGMMARVSGEHLGGIFITKIPPGESVLPHSDSGWHPEFYNTKLYLPIQTNKECVFYCGDEEVTMLDGDIWRVDNTKEHSVVNNGNDDRMTLIVCIRCEG